MFDIFLLLLILFTMYYHMTHCGKCDYRKTRCDLCSYGRKHGKITECVLKDMKELEHKHKNDKLVNRQNRREESEI